MLSNLNRRRFLRTAAGVLVPAPFVIGQSLRNPAFVARLTSSVAKASFTDGFVRADANPMSNPGSGGTWTSGPGVWADVRITSNQINNISGASGARVLTPSFAANQKATVTVGSATAAGISACVRITSTSNASCYMAYLTGSTAITVYKVTDTGTQSLAALGANITISAIAQGDTIGISASGDSTVTLEVFHNGVSKGTRTDSSSPYTSGQPGMYVGSTSKYISGFTATDL